MNGSKDTGHTHGCTNFQVKTKSSETDEVMTALTLTKPPMHSVGGMLKRCKLSLFSTGYSAVQKWQQEEEFSPPACSSCCRLLAKWNLTDFGGYRNWPCICMRR